jgi:hypothetical protein
MPIAFNEPLSFLQRITEYMEHVYLIHKASSQSQPLERMQVRTRYRGPSMLLGGLSRRCPVGSSFAVLTEAVLTHP